MATEGGGKMKLKRQNADSRPYARRQSLLGRMKNTVKDMLAPSWVIDLVNGVRKTSPKHRQGCEPLQHEPDGEIPVTRALNRMSSEDNMMQNATNAQPHSTTLPSAPANPMSYTPQQMPYNSYRPPASIPHLMTNGDDQSDASDYSAATSVCSSMVPQPDRKDYQGEIIQMNDSHLRQMQQHMEMRTMSPTVHNTSNADVANSSTSNAMEGSFLWSSKPRASKPQPPAKSRMPSFNTSLMSPSTSDKTAYHQSTYYPGKTTFGGAASYRKARIKQSPMPYEPSPMRKQVQARPLNNSSLGGVTSSTAKRILDTLERMSTPLSDAKKIPLAGNMSDSIFSMTPGTYRKRRTPNTSLSQSVTEGPPTSRRTLSSFASIATNLHSCSNVTRTTQAVSTDHTIKSITVEHEPQHQTGSADRGGGCSGKMKRDRGGHYSRKQADEEEVDMPDLPTSFVLPVSNFSLPQLSGSFSVATPSTDPSVTCSADASIATTNSCPDFSFSSPIVKSSTADFNAPVVNTQFQFSSPIAVDQATSKSASSPPMSGFTFTSSSMAPKMKPPAVNFKAPVDSGSGFKPAAELMSGSVMDVLGKKTSSEVNSGTVMDVLGRPTPNGNIGGIQPASVIKTGSVMDVLGKSSTASLSSGTNSLSFLKVASSGWTCDTCLIQNKGDASTCMACETAKPRPKPTPVSASTISSSSSGSLSHLMKQSGSDWTCDTCLIQNKHDRPKCVACETPKPLAAPPAPTHASSSGTNSLGFLKTASSGWMCEMCLIQNKGDVSTCVACEMPKPGAKPVSSSSSTNTFSNTQAGVKPFQFGKLTKKASGWECDTCLVSNSPESNKCVACEMPRPGAQPPTGFTSTGGFSFGVGGGFSSSSSSSLAAPATPSAAGFNFANPSATEATSEPVIPAGFSFGGKSNEKTSEMKSAGPSGGFQFGEATSSNAAKLKQDEGKPNFSGTSGFKFGGQTTKLSASDEKEKTKSEPFGGFKFGGVASKTTPSENNAIISGTAPSGGFKFGPSAKSGSAEEKTLITASPSVNYQFGQITENTPSEKPAVSADSSLFQFGQTKDANANVSKPLGAGSTGGFRGFSNSPVKNDTPASSFQFNAKPTDSINSKETGKEPVTPVFGVTKTSEPTKALFGATADKPAASAGGFQFGSTNSAPSPASGGFAFGANGVTNSKTEAKPTGTMPIFTFGGPTNNTGTKAAPFSFGANAAAKPAENSGQLPTANFNFKPNAPLTSATSPGKRGRIDMESDGDGKKPKVSFTTAAPTYNSGFKFDDAKPATTTAPTPSFSFGQTSTNTAFGTNNTTNNSTPGGFGGFRAGTESSTTGSVFGAPAPQAGTVFRGSAPSNTPNAFGSIGPAPAFGAPTTTAAPSGGMNLTTPASFNFASAANTAPSSGLFQFSANNQSNTVASAGGASTNFAFGQGGETTQSTAPAATPAPAFNATPSFNFTGSAGTSQNAVFTAGSSAPGFTSGSSAQVGQSAVFGFNATGGAAAGTNNPFNATSAAGNANNPRRIKKAVRKLRK